MLQHYLTRPMRGAAAAEGRPEALSLWARQGAGLARPGRAADLMARWIQEAVAVRGEL